MTFRDDTDDVIARLWAKHFTAEQISKMTGIRLPKVRLAIEKAKALAPRKKT